MKRGWMAAAVLAVAGTAGAVELIRDGQPLAEIVIATNPSPSVRVAAQELQKYLGKMSGARLPIVTEPTGKTPVYVGPGEHTDRLGITLDDVKDDGFKIIVRADYMALLGRDQCRPPIPRNNTRFGLYDQLNREWEAQTGHKWEYPRIVRDPRQFNPELGFSYYDANGTLYAVYEFLESLGMRWFMPIEELGQVIPSLATIASAPREEKREPRFSARLLYCLVGGKTTEHLWFKSLKQGGMFDQWPAHSSMAVTKFQQDRTNLMALAQGRMIPVGKDTFLPRLSSPELRAQLAEYLIHVGDAFPEMPYMPIGQPDGWVMLGDDDVAAGWDKREEGDWGRFSDYTWEFVLDVAGRVRARRPNAKFNTMSYGHAKLTPKNVAVIPADIAIYFTQNSTMWHLPALEKEPALREEWLKKAPRSDFFIYDYYLFHAGRNNTPPVPMIFTALLERNLKGVDARFKGIYTEVATGGGATNRYDVRIALPGLNHLMLYLHGKLAWDREVDVPALLADYYEKFYGPAHAEMREFFEYSEKIWMRPDPRQITAVTGFLKPADVPVYFDILARAKAKAGDSLYGRRIDLILDEIAPMKKLFSELQRTGPYVRVRAMDIAAGVDGDLGKPFWTERHPRERAWLRDCATGASLTSNGTAAAFRWLPDDSLLIGLTCHESRMDSLYAATSGNVKDDNAIYNDDTVEVHLETPEGYTAVIVVNPNGAVRDTCTTPNAADVPIAWNADRVAVRKVPDRWTVEIKVKGLGAMPTKSYPWGVNVFRLRLAGGVRETQALSPTGKGGFLGAASKMGNLYGP